MFILERIWNENVVGMAGVGGSGGGKIETTVLEQLKKLKNVE